MKTINILTGRAYDVHIGHDILPRCGKRIAAISGQHYQRIALVTDDAVAGLYGEVVETALRESGFQVCTFVFPRGEGSKTMETALNICTFLVENQITRSDLLVALGGGVVGDLAGFASSIYQRGIDYVQIPTTFLAAVDSSVGGKTAVNIPAGKNLLGAFWQPRLVICDVDMLSTLDRDAFGDGVAETIKYGCIWDEELFSLLEREPLREQLSQVVARCVEIKAQVVAADERDNALRQILNFGHTVGHAVEKLSGFSLSHGRGVAIGMCVAADAGERAGFTPAGTGERIRALLRKYDLPTDCDYPPTALADACLGDKKRHGNTLNLVLLKRIGNALIHPLPTREVEDFLFGERGDA